MELTIVLLAIEVDRGALGVGCRRAPANPAGPNSRIVWPSNAQLARPAGEYLDGLYVDTVGYAPAPLAYCYAQLGADRLVFGTDHPYAVPRLPQDLVDRLPCTDAERQQILAGNARRLLRLETAVAEPA